MGRAQSPLHVSLGIRKPLGRHELAPSGWGGPGPRVPL